MYNQSTERKDENIHKANPHGWTPTHIRFFGIIRQLTDCALIFVFYSLAQIQTTSLSRFLQVISSKEIMAFKVGVYYSFIPTKHSTWQNQRTLSVPSSTFSSFLSPSLPPKPDSLKSVDPLNKSQQASMQYFPSEEFHLPCLLSWRGGFLSLTADSTVLLGFVKLKSPFPLSNVAAIYCHSLINRVTCQHVFQHPPASNPECLCTLPWIYFPWIKELIRKTFTNL